MNISKTYTFYLELLSGCSFCPTIQSLANDHGQVLVLSVFTQQLKVYLFTTPALHLFFHSSFPRPAGLGRPAGVQQCGNEALSLYRAETGTRGSLTSAEHRASPGSIVRSLDGFMLNNQHSEVREPESKVSKPKLVDDDYDNLQ